jgi:hypothetical protein
MMLQLVSRHTGRVRVVPTLAFTAFLFLLASPAFAQNLVQNPDFNTALPPWTQFLSSAPDPAGAGTATWVASPDLNSNPASGSAAITIAASPAAQNAASGIDECFAFAGGTMVSSVNYGASFLVPAANAADGGANATIEIRLFSDNACANFISGAGGSQGQDIVAGIPNSATWRTISDGNFLPPNTPLAAGSAQVRAYLRKNGASANTYSMNVDHVFVFLNGTTPVQLEQFYVE